MNKKFIIVLLVVVAPAIITVAFFALVMPILLLLGATSRLSARGIVEGAIFSYFAWQAVIFWWTCTKKGRESLGVRW